MSRPTPPSLIRRRSLLAGLAGGAALAAGPGISRAHPHQPASGSAESLDSIVEGFMRAFEIPGVGVAIVRPDAPPLIKTWGVRTLGQAARVGPHTQFAIASNSKAFLSACLAILVDEGKLGWDDPVVDHLPEFEMHDPAITAMMTVRDLLVHRSGLPLGAGDLLIFPRTDREADDVLRALKHFRPATGFRAGYAYDNTLYIVAGVLLQRVSGLGWDAFVQQRIFTPLGMRDAVSNPTLVRGDDHAGRHARLGPPTRGIGELVVVPANEGAVIGPAGGINASLTDIVPWLTVQLSGGALPDGARLWSAAQSAEMWKPQTLIGSGPGPTAAAPQRSVMSGYALGWGVADYRGRRMLSHSGGLAGLITRTTLLPDQGIGFVVFTNTEDSDPVSGLRYAIMDHLLEVPDFDWLGHTRRTIDETVGQVSALLGSGDFPTPSGGPSLPLERYAGLYRDPWYGDIRIARSGASLTIDFLPTPAFKSVLEPFGVDAFRTRFPRGAGEDAVLSFAIEQGAVTGVTMKALSPIADFSFDFHDLAFRPIPT